MGQAVLSSSHFVLAVGLTSSLSPPSPSSPTVSSNPSLRFRDQTLTHHRNHTSTLDFIDSHGSVLELAHMHEVSWGLG